MIFYEPLVYLIMYEILLLLLLLLYYIFFAFMLVN